MAELQTFHGTVLESGDEARSRLLAAPSEEELIPTALELAQDVLRASVVGLALVRPERAGLHVELSSSDGRFGRADVAGLVRQAMQAGEALLDPFSRAGHSQVEGEGMPAGSVLALPLKARGALLGALVLWREQALAPFTPAELRGGKTLAAEIALALDNVRLRRELSRSLEELATAHSAVARAEAHAQAIIDAAQEGIILFDAQGVVQDFNPQAAAIFGWPRGEAVGHNLADIAVPPRLLPIFKKHLESAFRQGRDPLNDFMEVYALRRNGEEFPMEISTSVIETPRGKFLSTFCRDITSRKQADKALQESESKLQAIFNAVETGIFVIDPETHRIVDANPVALKLTGLPRERVVGAECHKFVCPADKGRCPVTDLGQTVDNSERVLLTAAGEARDILKTVRPVVIAGRKFLLESFTDITPRKRAEQAVSEAETRFRSLFASIPLPTYLWDLETLEYLEVNDAAVSHSGYSREELLSMRLTDLLPPEDVPGVLSRVQELRHLAGHSDAGRHRTKAGRIVDVEIDAQTMDFNGRRAVLSVVQNVTDRKRAEQALRESEERYRLLFENNLAGVYRTAVDGRALHCNHALATMLGFDSPEEVLAHRVSDFYFSQEERDKFLEKLKAEGGFSNLEMRLRRKDGTPLWVLASVNCSTQGSSPCQVIEGTLVDITERKRAEGAMAERHRLATLLAEVGVALTGAETLRQGLQRCAEVLVRDIDATFARVWTLNEKDNALELQASAGMYTHIDGGHARVPLGKFKIGRIAQTGEPHLTNRVLEDSSVGDPDWARREGMVAFAGYPLKVEERVLGVVAAFARKPLTEATLQAFASVSHGIAQFIERKRAEEALRDSEEQYRALIETTGTGYVIIDAGGRVIDANSEYLRLAGKEKLAEVVGHRVTEWTAPEEVARNAEGVRRCTEVGFVRNHETVHVNAQGKRTPIEVNATVLPVAGGDHIVALCRDITDRKRADLAVRESEERYRLLFERNLAGVFRGMLLSRHILDCNDAYARILGYDSRQEVLDCGKLHDFCDPAQLEIAKARLHKEKAVTNFEARVCRKDRTPIWVLENVSFIEAGEGNEPLVEGTLIDISKRKRAEQALWESEAQLSAILNNSTAVIYLKDVAGRYIRVNREFETLFGLEPGQVVGKTDHDLFPKELADNFQTNDQRVVRERTSLRFEETAYHDGSSHTYLSVKFPLYDASERVYAVAGISTDITEQKRAEEALRKSEERYRRLFERNLTGVFQGTLDGHILDCNDAYARILGYNSREEVLRLERLDCFFDPQEGIAAANVLQREGSQTNFEIRLKRRDGSPVSVLANVILAHMGEGRPPLVEGTLIDISARKRAEEQTRLLTAALESAANGIVIAGRDGRILWVNPAFTRLTGYPGEEVLGQTMRVLKSGQQDAHFYQNLWQTILAGGAWRGELVNRHKDGTLYTDEMTITPVRDAHGAITHFIAVKQDVTERKRAANALQERTTYLNTLIEISPVSIVVIDTKGCVQMSNPAFEKLFLYSRREMQGANLDELIIPVGMISEAEYFTKQCLSGAGVHAISRRRRKDGTLADVEIYGVPLVMGGQARGTLALYQDITERKRSEEALRASEERYRELFENASDLVFTTDLRGRLTSLNQVAAQTIGYSCEEATQMTLQQLVDPRHHQRIEQTRERILGGDPEVTVEVEILAKDGRRVMLEVKPRLVYKEGEPVAMQGIGRDITGREAAEVELRQAQKLESVGRLAAGIAHEINTPIQFVGDNTRFLQDSFGGLQTLLTKYQELRDAAASSAVSADLLAEVRRAEEQSDCAYLLEEIPKALSQTLDGVTRVATIVHAMKDFAHPESKERAAADLNKALQSTLTVARNELKYVADVETEFGELPLVVCHISDLNQVFLNLLVNAAHAIGEVVKESGKKGKIRVRTVAEGKTVLIAISDTGSGIPEEIRNRVFDPFFTTKEVGRGTGQGLAIARSVVVERHKGSLSFESEEGKGTTFYVRLPVEPGEASEGESADPVANSSARSTASGV